MTPHRLAPTVTSKNESLCSAASWYSSGFRKPSGDLPAARRASFSRETTPANTGALADVPSGCYAHITGTTLSTERKDPGKPNADAQGRTTRVLAGGNRRGGVSSHHPLHRTDGHKYAGDDRHEVVAHCDDVRVCASVAGEQVVVGQQRGTDWRSRAVLGEVTRDSISLVPRLRGDGGESCTK